MKTVAILGANGVYGRHLAPRLASEGYKVRALVRRIEVADMLRSCGADVRIADIFDAEGLFEALEGCDICINLATSLPGPSGRGEYDANDRLRRDGTPLLVNACKQIGVERLVQQSIAMVGAAGEAIADERTVYEPVDDDAAGRAIRAALAMEATVRSSGLDWILLRGALFYGPGTGFDDDWFARAATGKLRLPGDGSDFVTLIHIADMAAATVAALETWPSRQTLIIADDMPARWRDVLGYVAGISRAEAPQPGGRAGFPSFRMSNRLARRTLPWSPRYADYRSGLAR